jgi:Tfp pilus assembly protein PilP
LSRLNRILLVIVIILAAATALVWFKPDLLSSFSLSSLSSLNPFSREKKEVVTTDMGTGAGTGTAQLPVTEITADIAPDTAADVPATVSMESPEPEEAEIKVVEAVEEELTPFEKEIKQRHESYETRIYTYKPYEPPVLRNPFQRIVSSVYVEEGEEERLAKELSSAEDIRRFVTPELPAGTKFTGLISSGVTKLAIIEMDEETYIAKEGDLIDDKYLIKSIQDDRVIIDINGYDIAQKLGGEEDINE